MEWQQPSRLPTTSSGDILYASIQAAETPTSKLRSVTPGDKESSMSTLWQVEEFKQICNRESLTEKAADIEKTIVVREHERARYEFDLTMFYENWFWNRRPDGTVINFNKYHWTLCILEFKRSSDRNEVFLRVKKDEANEQPWHRSIVQALRAAAPDWTFEQINLVAGRRGAVVEDDFYNKPLGGSKNSMYKQGKGTKFCWRMCNAYEKRMTQ